MPKTSNTNRLMADYVSQAGLTRVYIGVQAHSKDTVSICMRVHTHTATGVFFSNFCPLRYCFLKQDDYLGANCPET